MLGILNRCSVDDLFHLRDSGEIYLLLEVFNLCYSLLLEYFYFFKVAMNLSLTSFKCLEIEASQIVMNRVDAPIFLDLFLSNYSWDLD